MKNLGAMVGSLVVFAAIATSDGGPLFALVFVGGLAIHELGHVGAARLEGINPKGVYFIPMIGAVTMFERLPATPGVRVRVFLMGPVFGLISALGFAVIGSVVEDRYLSLTGRVLFWLNAPNLLPAVPLDGGRILEAILANPPPRTRLVVLAVGLFISVVALYGLNLPVTAAALAATGALYLWATSDAPEPETAVEEAPEHGRLGPCPYLSVTHLRHDHEAAAARTTSSSVDRWVHEEGAGLTPPSAT